MTRAPKNGGARYRLVRGADGEADLDPEDQALELLVRHRWDHGYILIIALTMLVVGVLLGLVASHAAAIERLEHDLRLTLTWAQTHRHSAAGEQPEAPEDIQEMIDRRGGTP